jgi:hypothetical protein
MSFKINSALLFTVMARPETRTRIHDSKPIELPSMEEIKTTFEEPREMAIGALEFSKDNKSVRCQNQKCRAFKPILNTAPRADSMRISRLKAIIKAAEAHKLATGVNVDCRRQKEELAYLLREQEKRDLFRRLPLYSSLATDFKFVCSSCYDEMYVKKRLWRNKTKENR